MEITIKFDKSLNKSLQKGDTIWYVGPAPNGGYSVADKEDVKKMGTVEEISDEYQAHQIKISRYHDPNDPNSFSPAFLNGAFFMFSKNDVVNLGDIKGYFAEVQLNNNSKKEIELFSVGSEISQSSK